MKPFARLLLPASSMLFVACSLMSNNVTQSASTATFTVESTITLTPNVPRTIAAKLTKAAAPHATTVAQVNSTYNAQQTLTALVPTRTPEPPSPLETLSLTALASEPETTAETLTLSVLRKYVEKYPSPYRYQNAGNMFGIQIVKDTLDPQWINGEGVTNDSSTLKVYFSYAPEPTPNPAATMTVDEFLNSLQAKKMVVENLKTGDVYWVKWKDDLPWRQIQIIGWLDGDVFVFSQCGNPSLCFVTGIDAGKRKFLLTLGLNDYR